MNPLNPLSSITISDIKKNQEKYNEPDWLVKMRESAFSKYLELPSEVSPLYSKYSDVNRLEPKKVFPFSDSPGSPFTELAARIDQLQQEDGILKIGPSINFVKIPQSIAEQGVIISDLAIAIREHENLVKEYLPVLSNYAEDRFLALESAAFQSGLFIYIPPNTEVKEQIRIVNSLDDKGYSDISRIIIVAERNSRATVVQELYAPSNLSSQNMQQAYIELVQSHVKSNANLEMVTLQAMGTESVNISNRKAFVEADGKMSWYLGLFGSKLSRYKVDSIMNGQGASAEDVEIVFGAENQSFDITSNLIHNARNSRGRVLVKSVLKDKSKSLFKGMIKIGNEAKATESYLAGHAILLDKGAKSDAIPGLEIETNEVKATHAASVAQMDEAQLFYLMSRGLSREMAKREIVSGFLEPLSRKMGPTVRAWINYLIENKWLGKSLVLKPDEAMEQILEVERSRYRETQDIFEKHYKYR